MKYPVLHIIYKVKKVKIIRKSAKSHVLCGFFLIICLFPNIRQVLYLLFFSFYRLLLKQWQPQKQLLPKKQLFPPKMQS